MTWILTFPMHLHDMATNSTSNSKLGRRDLIRGDTATTMGASLDGSGVWVGKWCMDSDSWGVAVCSRMLQKLGVGIYCRYSSNLPTTLSPQLFHTQSKFLPTHQPFSPISCAGQGTTATNGGDIRIHLTRGQATPIRFSVHYLQ